MRTIETPGELSAFLRILQKRAGGVDTATLGRVNEILSAVRKEGDRALLRFTKRFDCHSKLKLSQKEIEQHSKGADRNILKALRLFARRIRSFHEMQKEKSWSYTRDGITLGQLIRPVERAGVYVPGGTASYPSTVLMNVIPAQVAGVKEIAVTVPVPRGEVNPYVMAAIKMLGVKEVYPVGGAQAIAALAYGTKSIKKVDKIVGPGNIYVATAKKLVFGEVDIDMVAGPSEILIIADSTARADFIAADLLSQAEHDELASSVLVTSSRRLANAVKAELATQLSHLQRSDIAKGSLKRYGAIVIVKNMADAVELSNTIAPEHLEVMVKNPQRLVNKLTNAGAIFLGDWSTEPLGDYGAGPNHTLPTGGTARFSSPLGVYDFMKRSSLLRFTRKGFDKLAGPVASVADIEGLGAHANAVRIRMYRK